MGLNLESKKMKELAGQLKISDVIDEYNKKYTDIKNQIEKFKDAGGALITAANIMGTFGQVNIDVGRVSLSTIEDSLLKSAWLHIFNGLNLNKIATAQDKKIFNQSLLNPAPFTMGNIRGAFGDYILDPRKSILRGLAEVFCTLDNAYKSHDKVKIGVEGLPKRVILGNVGSLYGYSFDKIKDMINALAIYQNKDMVKHGEVSDFIKGELCLKDERGIWIKTFKNRNAHIFFNKETLNDINKALAEYYGDVLPDCYEDKPTELKKSTEVSKDLQYYPTPQKVVDQIMLNLSCKDKLVLEPSCGCGVFLEAIRKQGGRASGYEYHAVRANIARNKGFGVLTANFLQAIPEPIYDMVIMNPPFYGLHYAKHIEHALKFLKDGGELISILPATARYDHGLLKGRWCDLPLGSFKESGTNINTTILKIRK